METYSDLIERVLLMDPLLDKLQPADISNRDLWRRIREADDTELAGGKSIGDPELFALVRGGVNYALDDLDGCHAFFQDAPGDLAAYWHGMMHRREGDFDNARYWFRRAGQMPFFGALHGKAAPLSDVVARQLSWDPYLFTGQCEQARFGAVELSDELAKLQRAEFDVVFDYTWRQAKVS